MIKHKGILDPWVNVYLILFAFLKIGNIFTLPKF